MKWARWARWGMLSVAALVACSGVGDEAPPATAAGVANSPVATARSAPPRRSTDPAGASGSATARLADTAPAGAASSPPAPTPRTADDTIAAANPGTAPAGAAPGTPEIGAATQAPGAAGAPITPGPGRPAVTVDATSGAGQPHLVGPEPPPVREWIDITLRSTPPGATVSVDGAVVGATPTFWRGAKNQAPRAFRFDLAGHQAADFAFVPVRSGVLHPTLVPTRTAKDVAAGPPPR